jgi:endonuclease/exonuclease/phosphatase family metal-dependent hydrolase
LTLSAALFAILFAVQPPSARAVKVVSWNLHGLPFIGAGPRMAVTGAKIREIHPDFVFLQEVWLNRYASTLKAELHAAGYVEAEYRSIAPIRTGGLLVFVDPRRGWRIVSTRFVEYDLSGPAWRVWEGDGLSGKGMLIIEVENAAKVRRVLIDTHLQSQYGARDYAAVRGAQLDQLLREATSHKAWLIAGDFNMRDNDDLYSKFAANALRDATTAFRKSCACATYIGEGSAADWIDYVLLADDSRSDVSLIRNRSSDNPYSDHEGLIVGIDPQPRW